MKINLLGGTAASRFPTANSQASVNWFPVAGPGDKSEISLQPTPGLTTYTTLPGRYGRGLFTFRTAVGTKLFAVVDKVLYEITTNGTYTTIGTLTNLEQGSSRLNLECNMQNELGIFGRSASYVYDVDTGALTQITDVDFPDNIGHATYLDQYGIVVANGYVFESDTTGFLNWTSVQTYAPTFKAAPVIAVGALREQIFNFTTEAIEVFINDGSSPYARLPRSTVSIGILSEHSLATWSNGFVFLGKAKEGEAAIFFYDGWNPPTPISDANISWKLNQAATLEDAYGYVQQTKNGAYWYYLTIPSLNDTLVYDFSTKLWHNRRSQHPALAADGTPIQGAFRGAFHANFNGKSFFLDAFSGKIFVEDYTVNTEDSVTIRRERISPEVSEENKYLSHYQMVIDASTGRGTAGASPVLQVYSSNDGGITFGSPRNVALGAQGQYLWQARINKLGTSRRRVYKFVLTDDIDLMIQNIYLNATLGKN
jgi:hypothetical protein